LQLGCGLHDCLALHALVKLLTRCGLAVHEVVGHPNSKERLDFIPIGVVVGCRRAGLGKNEV